jgi:hypothetical protein
MKKAWKILAFIPLVILSLLGAACIVVITYFAFSYYLVRELWRSLDYQKETQAPSDVRESCVRALQEQAEKEKAGDILYN